MQTQIDRNNFKSMMLLLLFPCLILGMIWVFLAATYLILGGHVEDMHTADFESVNEIFLECLPWVVGGVSVWFLIAYLFNSSMVRMATGARPLERRENMRVYNIVENLCMTCGMDMPKVFVVNDPQLNAYASGIDKKSYAVTLTTGILQRLDDEELAGVIAHELTHIRNRDTRLLITSIIFVGIISTVMSMVTRLLYYSFWSGGRSSSRSKNGKDSGAAAIIAMVIALVCLAITYVFILLTRFAISRKREYMADAGGAELCGNPLALASALRKISNNPGLQSCKRDDVAQLFIVHQQNLDGGVAGFFSNMFSTHPDIQKRIEILEQF